MKLIQEKFPGREQIIKLLWNMIPENNHSMKWTRPGSFLLYGTPATGKTAILSYILDSKQIPYIFQNCCECDDLPTLYTLILMKLFERFEHLDSIRTFWEFITCFQRADSAIREIRFIILKNLESLGSTVYEQFSVFQTYLNNNGWNLRIVFISNDVSIEDMNTNVYYIQFTQYNQDQLRSILLLKRPDYPDQLYHSFLNVFLPSVYNNQRDLRALLRLVDFLFPIYIKPVNEGTILADNVSALFRNICPYLQGNTDRILLFPDRFMKKQADDSKMFYSLDLPYCTKYLLLAAYMASFIPSKHDRLFFCHRSLKKKKKGNSRSASNTKVNTLVGPRSFSVNRLIAIYLAISGERSISAVSLSQVTYLIELRLLVISGNAQYINLDTPKYKCVAPVELINIVAKSLNFDLTKYQL